MDNKTKKITGWILVFAGLVIIFSDLYSSFSIFTARTPAPEIFKTQIQGTSQKSGNDIQNLMVEQISKAMPSDSMPKILNLSAWAMFAAILAMIGGKVSSIGSGLLK